MQKIKITVIKCAFHEDLVRDYARPGLGPCTYNREGMEFVCENGCYMADGKFGQLSVVMQDKDAVLALTGDCETPHETLKTFWDTVYPLL